MAATLASLNVPFPDNVNVSEPIRLLRVKSLELAVVVASYSLLPEELNTLWVIAKELLVIV